MFKFLTQRKDNQKKKPKFPKGTGMTCVVCGKNQANATCVQCGGKVCPSHSNYVKCLVLCPRCKSHQISANKGGFDTGGAIAGWALGGPIVGGLIGLTGMNDVGLYCHACGHRWKPTI